MTKHKKNLKNRVKKVGMPAGTLQHFESAQKATISLIQYNKESLVEKDLRSLKEVNLLAGKVSWINVNGIHDVQILEEAGQKFNIHSLILEDISSPDQRPKADEYDNHLFVTLRMLDYMQADQRLDSEQVSLVLSDNFLLTFQEREGDIFNPNRERLRSGKGRSRGNGPDYLMYSLIDTVVDNYFVILEEIGEKIEDLEFQMIRSPQQKHIERIYKLKNDVNYLKKSVWPLRELINKLIRDENSLIKPETRIFFKDIYDHCVQIIDNIESFRDVLTSLMDLYLNSVNNRMNEVMKVLTIIATIFIPLTFITGIYGMNFEYMPELRYKYSYPILLMLLLLIIAGQLYIFKRKRWL